jgi:2-polyprenyl-6-hydroxyphenyl methylase/3-demethylubiquinone-9 3-methyltransferase
MTDPASGFDRNTIDETDLAKYDRLGEEWWDPKGPMGQLHKFNPVRVRYITDALATTAGPRPLEGVRLLDVGCGGGILCESLARLGAQMVGIDPAANNIAVAERHAEKTKLNIDYRCTSVATLARSGAQNPFDAVLVMEVIEHVKDVGSFITDCARLVKPGGLMFGATLNRTLKSYALAIVGAEYVLRWLPRGTHNWHQFVTPDEFTRYMRHNGLKVTDAVGVTYNPVSDRWGLSRDMGCNYMVVGKRLG